MPGFTHDRLCKHLENCDPAVSPNAFRGKCGNCRGECEPCAPDGSDCGEWQDCNCVVDGCGDGHSCKRYIDITFTLKEFIIQGETCCNGCPPLAQPCNGAYQNNQTPIIGSPTGWAEVQNGVQDTVSYQETTHHVRLVKAGREQPFCQGGQGGGGAGEENHYCGCFWGGYWSSSCDCNNCCCGDDETYPDCDCANVVDSSHVLECGSEPPQNCHPSNPCMPPNNGFASSLDSWTGGGNVEKGGSTGQALCTMPDDPSSTFTTDICDGYDSSAFACWSCGTFKPHHIEAYMTMGSSTNSCDSWWILEIRGLTEQARGNMGASNQGLDCLVLGEGSDTCSELDIGGVSEPALAYRGRWRGTSAGNCQKDCEDGTFGLQPELSAYGCTCPPNTEFESTVRTDALVKLHPKTIYSTPTPSGQPAGAGRIHMCVVPDDWCNTTYWAAYAALFGAEVAIYDGTYYGPPMAWWDQPDYCALCCNGNWANGCPCDDCDPCGCPWPNDAIPTLGAPQSILPCSHCSDDINNPEGCSPCPVSGHAHMCADVEISIVPNNSPTPAWVEPEP